LTRNPYVLDRNPCGSSSGSGVAVSANLCSAAVGTETDGSIVCPATTNGIVGIKPTLGLVSRSGIIPISHSQDTAGPMARTVADAAILLGVIAGVDPRDDVTQEGAGKSFTDYTRFLDLKGLQGARIGVARKYFGFSDEVDRLMNDAIEVMKRSGATVIDPVDLATSKEYEGSELEVLLYEFKHDLNKYLSELGPKAPFRSLKEIIEFNEKNRGREMTYFSQELFLKAEAKGPLNSRDYLTRWRKTAGCRVRRELTRLSPKIVWTPSSRRPAALRGRPIWSTAIISPEAARPRRRSRVIRPSASRQASFTGFRSGSRFSARLIVNLR
jgi:amidase